MHMDQGMVAGNPSTLGDGDRRISVVLNSVTRPFFPKIRWWGGGSKMAQRVKAPATEPDHLSLIIGPLRVLEEN